MVTACHRCCAGPAAEGPGGSQHQSCHEGGSLRMRPSDTASCSAYQGTTVVPPPSTLRCHTSLPPGPFLPNHAPPPPSLPPPQLCGHDAATGARSITVSFPTLQLRRSPAGTGHVRRRVDRSVFASTIAGTATTITHAPTLCPAPPAEPHLHTVV